MPGDGNGSGSGDADADKDEGRRLFAHYLWGGALVVADGVEGADSDSHKSGKRGRGKWDVRGQRVLEVGAGKSLLCCALFLCVCFWDLLLFRVLSCFWSVRPCFLGAELGL